MTLLLNHTDSPYIRAIGFLYLRFVGDPKCLYKWIEPYLYDDEPIQAKASSAKQFGSSETMGEYIRRLFTDKNYYGTILPRLPIHMEREIQVKLLQAEKVEERAKKHATNPRTMSCFQKLGAKVMALYGDEENPVQWYQAVVDRVITTNPETMQQLRHPKFVVTFPEYGNTETVTLGEMEMIGVSLNLLSDQPQRGGCDERLHELASFKEKGQDDHFGTGRREHAVGYGDRGYGQRNHNSRGRGYRDHESDNQKWDHREDALQRDNSRPSSTAASLTTEAELYEEVRRRERDTVASSSRNAIARRPPTTKASLSLGSREAASRRMHSTDAPLQTTRKEPESPLSGNLSAGATPVKKRTSEEMAMIEAKKRKLMAKYC